MTTYNSTEYGNGVAHPRVMNDANQYGGKKRFWGFDYTQVLISVAEDLVNLIELPAGKVRLVLPECRIAFSAGGASRTMNVGWAAHTLSDGTAVVADENGLDDGVDISSAGSVLLGGTVGGAETYLFDTRDGVIITATLADDTFPAAGTLNGYFTGVIE